MTDTPITTEQARDEALWASPRHLANVIRSLCDQLDTATAALQAMTKERDRLKHAERLPPMDQTFQKHLHALADKYDTEVARLREQLAIVTTKGESLCQQNGVLLLDNHTLRERATRLEAAMRKIQETAKIIPDSHPQLRLWQYDTMDFIEQALAASGKDAHRAQAERDALAGIDAIRQRVVDENDALAADNTRLREAIQQVLNEQNELEIYLQDILLKALTRDGAGGGA